MVAKVEDILKAKGSAVKIVGADQTVFDVAKQPRANRIGAAIISSDGSAIEGIISERDIAYGLATHSNALPELTVDQLMTRDVIACSPSDTIEAVMQVMTHRRIRHLTVKSTDRLVGMISIRDVLKRRVEEIQFEADGLRAYAIARN